MSLLLLRGVTARRLTPHPVGNRRSWHSEWHYFGTGLLGAPHGATGPREEPVPRVQRRVVRKVGAGHAQRRRRRHGPARRPSERAVGMVPPVAGRALADVDLGARHVANVAPVGAGRPRAHATDSGSVTAGVRARPCSRAYISASNSGRDAVATDTAMACTTRRFQAKATWRVAVST